MAGKKLMHRNRGAVDSQALGVLGMVVIGSVAVFTTDGAVRGVPDSIVLVLVTPPTDPRQSGISRGQPSIPPRWICGASHTYSRVMGTEITWN